MPLSPLDTTTTPEEAIQRRLAALEARVETFERERVSQFMYLDSPSPAATTAVFEQLEDSKPGTIMALKETNEVGGMEIIALNFGGEFGWYTV